MTTIETLLTRPHTSIIQTYVEQLETWTANNRVIINTNTTKEMFLGPLSKSSPDEIIIGQVKVEPVTGLKLLGIHITSDLKSNTHIDKICAKRFLAAVFLKQLKRAELDWPRTNCVISTYQLSDRY